MQGMPRRYPDFAPAYAYWNHIATIGYMVMAASIVIWLINIAYAFTMGKKAEGNYWGSKAIATLEWTLSSPPPFHQFETLPVIKDEGHHSRSGRPGRPGACFPAASVTSGDSHVARAPLHRGAMEGECP
jgi:heme/copper-type cytochrome/quinol oxidase subunit 1